MDERLAKVLLEDNIVTRLKQAEGDIDLLQKLATIKSVDLQTLPIPGTTNTPQAVNPGGWDKSVQYNDGGLFGGDANFTWDKTARSLTILGDGDPSIITGDAQGISIETLDVTATDGNAGAVFVRGGNGDGTGAGGYIVINGGDGGTDGVGGNITITAGNSQGTNDGQQIDINGGNPGDIGTGGAVNISASLGGSTSGDGGAVNISAGDAIDGDGGSITLTPGTGAGAGVAGVVTINGDVHFESDNMVWDKTAQTLTMIGSGAANIQGTEATGMLIYGGAAVTADTIGGTAAMGGGAGDGTGAGGEVGLVGGAGGATAPGGDVYLTGGFGGATSGAGGAVALEGGSALTSGNGGDVTLSPGAGAGAGVNGIVSVSNSDLHILGAGATGLVLYDATLAAYYRITLDNGVLIITAV